MSELGHVGWSPDYKRKPEPDKALQEAILSLLNEGTVRKEWVLVCHHANRHARYHGSAAAEEELTQALNTVEAALRKAGAL